MKPLAPWTVRLLATVGLALSAFLLAIGLTTESAVGCSWSGFDCDAALGSRWAKLFGAPVAAGGLLCYGAALAGSLLAGRRGAAGAVGWRLLEFAAPLAVGAGVWFTFLQATALESFCLYCLATHACGLAMAVAALVWRRLEASDEGAGPLSIGLADARSVDASTGPPSLGVPTAVGVLGVVALSIGQTLSGASEVAEYAPQLDESFDLQATADTAPIAEPVAESVVPDNDAVPTTDPEPRSNVPPRRRDGSRRIELLNGQLKIDTYDHALIGSPEAPHVALELMDYACPHCREFHEKLTEAIERFEGQVAVVIAPVPGEILCNPYITKAKKSSAGACYAAKLAMAVSELEPVRFERFHAWMLKADNIPSRTSSLIKAREFVDPVKLGDKLRDPDGQLAARIQQYVKLAGALARKGRFGLPAQVLDDTVLAGPPDSVDALCELWAEAFDLEVPTEAIPF